MEKKLFRAEELWESIFIAMADRRRRFDSQIHQSAFVRRGPGSARRSLS